MAKITLAGFQTAASVQYTGSTVYLRVYYYGPSEAFSFSDGEVCVPSRETHYFEQAGTLASQVATFTSFLIQPTSDIVNADVRTRWVLFDENRRESVTLGNDWEVPISLGSTVTFAELETHNATPRYAPPYGNGLERGQVELLISESLDVGNPAGVGVLGRVETATTPSDAAHPTVVLTDDPRLSGVVTSTMAGLPTAGTHGRLRKLTDGTRDVVIDTGTQWPSLTGATFNVKLFGAKGDNSTNDTAAIQAAITACGAAGGGVVYFPPGSYLVTGLTVASRYISLIGAGIGATRIRMTAATGDTLVTSGAANGVNCRHMSFVPTVTRTNGFEIKIPLFNPVEGYVILADLEFLNINKGISLGDPSALSGRIFVYNIHADTFDLFLFMVRVLDSSFHHWNTNAAKNASTTIYMDGGCEGNAFGNQLGMVNTAYVNGLNTGYALHVKADAYTGVVSRYNKFVGVYFDSHATGLFAEDGQDFRFSNCWFGGQPSAGIVLTGSVDDFSFVNCEVVNSSTCGMLLGGTGRLLVMGCSVLGNNVSGRVDKFSAGILLEQGLGGMARIIGNVSRTFSPYGTQTYGLWIENNGNEFIVTGNDFQGNSISGVNNLAGTATTRVMRHNLGHVTENDGTATVASGATAIAIAHGLQAVPALENISVVPTNFPTNNVRWRVTNPTSTHFTIETSADPGAGGATFAWSVIVR